MAAKSNVDALKRLCAKIIGGTTTARDIKGETIAEVIDAITAAYESSTPSVLGTLTLVSTPGTTFGTTHIAVTGASSGALFRYKATNTLPSLNEDLSTWTPWDGTSDIEAEDASKLSICEVDEDNLALKGGTVTANVNTTA